MTESTAQLAPEARALAVQEEAQANPVALFLDEQGYSQFFHRMKEAVSGFSPDLSTAGGRAAVASLAFRVTKAKTALDKAGKELTEGWRKQTAEVTAARLKMTAELDALAKDVRAPLTAWEEAEKVRKDRVEQQIQRFRNCAVVQEDDTAASVEDRGRQLFDLQLDPELFQDRLDEALAVKEATVQALLAARARLAQEEADRAELAKLRAEAEAREARELKEREEREAEERRVEEARQRKVEAERREAEEAERVRLAEERAAQAARDSAARQARERELEVQRQHDMALAKEREAAEKARQEAARLAQVEKDRKAAQDRDAAAQRAREADKAHRREVMAQVAEDLVEASGSDATVDALTPGQARLVALAIAAGNVRHLSIRF